MSMVTWLKSLSPLGILILLLVTSSGGLTQDPDHSGGSKETFESRSS
jgi:hypothetical protein